MSQKRLMLPTVSRKIADLSQHFSLSLSAMFGADFRDMERGVSGYFQSNQFTDHLNVVHIRVLVDSFENCSSQTAANASFDHLWHRLLNNDHGFV